MKKETKDFRACSLKAFLASERWHTLNISSDGGQILTPDMLQFHRFVPDYEYILSKMQIIKN